MDRTEEGGDEQEGDAAVVSTAAAVEADAVGAARGEQADSTGNGSDAASSPVTLSREEETWWDDDSKCQQRITTSLWRRLRLRIIVKMALLYAETKFARILTISWLSHLRPITIYVERLHPTTSCKGAPYSLSARRKSCTVSSRTACKCMRPSWTPVRIVAILSPAPQRGDVL